MIKGNDDISRKPYLGSIEIAQVYLGNTLVYPDGPTPPIDYSTRYLTFKALENGTFQFTGEGLSYSTDNGTTWTTLNSDTDTPTIAANNKIMFKGQMQPITEQGIGTFSSTGQFDVEGNPMSLLFGDNFIGENDLTGYNYAFYKLFKHCFKLKNANNLSLPATTLSSWCYGAMFMDCYYLVTTPELPATTLAESCYDSMFRSCQSLTTAPQLPATTLAEDCYSSMFQGCISLTTTPELPATTLSEGCYGAMFSTCESLTTAPQLPATTLAEHCYELMFDGCTSLTTAPILPAQTLVKMCYYGMFQDCTNLNSITCFATSISAGGCTAEWTRNVSATGTFTKEIGMSSWTTGDYGIPSGWTVDELVKMEITQASTSGGVKTLINEAGSTIVKQIIDGVQLPSASTTYNLSYGTHVIRYKFSNNIIGDAMFSNLDIKNLQIPSNITKIGKLTFRGCNGLTSVTIPNSVTEIDNSAFNSCSGLTNVTITNVQTIGGYAFSNCGNLNNLNILGGLVEIKIGAFENCTKLRWVELPDTVTAIRQEAFQNCTLLSEVYVYATTPPTLGSSAFAYNASGRIIYVPSTSVNRYKTASGWSVYASLIQAMP